MKIPDELKIRRSTWRIVIDDKIENTHNAVGLCIYSTKRIVLSPDQSRNELEDTFLHEILHACFPNGIVADRTEEKIVRRLAPVLLRVLHDNDLFGD